MNTLRSAWSRDEVELCVLQGMAQRDFARLKNLSRRRENFRLQRARKVMREGMTSACQVLRAGTGRVDDFIPRAPLAVGQAPPICEAQPADNTTCSRGAP